MKTLKFKTNIKCGGCIAAVTPYINGLEGMESWEADLQNPDKVLTVQADDDFESGAILHALEQAGYKAEEI